MGETSEPLADRFWTAVCANDLDTVEKLLRVDPSLASRDFRPPEEQDPHTNGFPLHRACAAAHWDLAQLLLEQGAEVDCRSPTSEQRELGMPLWWAVDRQNYDFAHRLLDRGADVHAYAWANASMLERLCEYALEEGAPGELLRSGFRSYLGEPSDEAGAVAVGDDAPESVKLLQRVLSQGGQPTCDLLVEVEEYALVEELLRTCPELPGTPHDDPPGTVFENLCNASSWYGRPQVMEMAMAECPHLHHSCDATRAIERAIVSHNRFGSVEDYFALIQGQLSYLRDAHSLAELIDEGDFLPHHFVARHYLWPNHYGYGPSKSSVTSMIALTQLLMTFGFVPDVANADGVTPQMLAKQRRQEGHAGMPEYLLFLQSTNS